MATIHVETLGGVVLGSRSKAVHHHKCDIIRNADGKKLGFVSHSERAMIRLIQVMSPEEILFVQSEVQKIRRRQHKAPVNDVVARMVDPNKIRALLRAEQRRGNK